MPTIRDLVKRCPGCGESVVYPYTQSFDLRMIRLKSGAPATKEEMDILRDVIPELKTAREIGVRIKTIRDPFDNLWHEPCFMLAEMNRWAVIRWKEVMSRLVYVINRRNEMWAYWRNRYQSENCALFALPYVKCCISCHEDEDLGIPIPTVYFEGEAFDVCCNVWAAYTNEFGIDGL